MGNTLDDLTNPGAIPQRHNTGAYSSPYAIAVQAPQQGYLPYNAGNGGNGNNNSPSIMQTWQVITAAIAMGATLVAGGWFVAARVFVTQDVYSTHRTEQVEINTSLKSTAAQNIATANRLETLVEKLNNKLDTLLNAKLDEHNERRRR